MKNKNTFLIALILVIVAATSIFVFAGGLRGESAYQVAVKNGYTGSESDWLLSLQGKDGKSVDYYNMYEKAKETGEIASTTTFLEFIQEYITTSGSSDEMLYSIQNSLLSSVCVAVFYKDTTESFNTLSSAGAGFVYDLQSDGTMYIITNYHVTYTSPYATDIKYYVTLYSDNYMYSESGKSAAIKANGIEMEYVGGNLNYDIAVLKASSTESKNKVQSAVSAGALKKAEIADPNVDLAVGTACYTIGNPMGEGMSVSEGIVSVAYEEIYINNITGGSSIQMRGVRVSCNINGGNSGGALYNSKGKVIGVINSKREYADASKANSEDIDGVSFAIPLSVALNVADAAIEQGTDPHFVDLGLEYATKYCTVTYDTATGLTTSRETAYVSAIEFGSPLITKLQANDIITSFSVTRGSTTTTIQMNHYYTLSDYSLKLKSGDILTINYSRSGTAGTTSITIA